MTTTPTTPTPAAAPQRVEPSAISRMPGTVVALAWRTRWHTAPLSVGGFVWLVGSAAPGVVALVMAVVAGLAYRAARHPHQRKRMFLSVRERDTLALWAAGCTVWALAVFAVQPEPRWSAAGLACLTAWPAVRWVGSRKVRARRHDRTTREHVKHWEPATRSAPAALQGSEVIKSTVKNPAPGATVFRVQLADGIHAKHATTEECRLAIEARYRLGEGTVALSMVRDDVTVIEVALSPARHLEGADGIPWSGPVIAADGRIPIAVTPTGEKVGPRLGTPDGAKHVLILGATGGGKSTTTKALLIPPAVQHRAIFVYIDGSGGRTLRKEGLAPFFAVAVTEREKWRHAIHLAHAVLLDREAQAASADLAWTIPWVYLVIEEAPAVAAEVGTPEHEMLRAITARGRAVFVGSIQIAQGANAEDIVGGVKARGNSTQIITHRPLDPLAMGKALATVPGCKNIDLMGLPPGPGWVATVDTGQVWPQARVERVTRGESDALADGFEPLQFTGADLAAAAPHLAILRGETVLEPTEGPDEPEPADARSDLMRVIRAHGGQVQIGDFVKFDGTRHHITCEQPECPGWPLGRRQTRKHLDALTEAEVLRKGGTSWTVV